MRPAPHHDGSELYVPEPPRSLGDEVTVRLRVPHGAAVDGVALRYVRDGEPRFALAQVDETTPTDVWWRASFPATNSANRYRWLLTGGALGYAWLTGDGVAAFDVPDADDFVLPVSAEPPRWHGESVVYEVFPDRFARSGVERQPPEWAVPRNWHDHPSPGRASSRDWFGGDLPGIEEHLDHVVHLGANVLYLTPVFPAGSVHRYDATSFDRVDPLLGGDAALLSLTAAAHARGMRVVGDLTLNHAGVGHEWFQAAERDDTAPERAFFLFGDEYPLGYEAWLGIASLPKLDYRSDELRRRLWRDPRSAARRWLGPDGGLDGWRIDVANMTARHGAVDLNHEVAQEVRAAVEAARPDAILVAEHAYDARDELANAGWHGTMNYSGFLRPVWAWLRGDVVPAPSDESFLGVPTGVPRLGGEQIVETMRRFRAGTPWEAVLNSWVLLDSHDTPRFSEVAGSRAEHLVGVGLQMTTPGVPMIWAGDELGVGGAWGEDSRRPMPWDSPETWDVELLEGYRALVRLRRASGALARGGMRYVHVDADVVAYLRETADERLLCVARRAAGPALRLPLDALGADGVETLHGEESRLDGRELVVEGDRPSFHLSRIE